MQKLPKKLQQRLQKRSSENALRNLGETIPGIDFSSNDYLGCSNNPTIFKRTSELLKEYNSQQNGATGSRLLTGNHSLYSTAETTVASFHQVEAALIFNSGYDANIGFFSCIPQRGDIIYYDELCHASIRDGICMSNAKSYKYKHNNLNDLKAKCQVERNQNLIETTEVYIVTESVFSMDGDSPDLIALAQFCKEHGFHLVVDEAHAIGVVGDKGEGLVQQLNLQQDVFACLVTFGKALGCHGAAILGSEQLKNYLINFARSFIYTTALPPHALATILAAYRYLGKANTELNMLKRNIAILQRNIVSQGLSMSFLPSSSAIHCCLVPGNDRVKMIAQALADKRLNVKPILSPTVPLGEERLRICVHSFNSEKEIKDLIRLLTTLLS